MSVLTLLVPSSRLATDSPRLLTGLPGSLAAQVVMEGVDIAALPARNWPSVWQRAILAAAAQGRVICAPHGFDAWAASELAALLADWLATGEEAPALLALKAGPARSSFAGGHRSLAGLPATLAGLPGAESLFYGYPVVRGATLAGDAPDCRLPGYWPLPACLARLDETSLRLEIYPASRPLVAVGWEERKARALIARALGEMAGLPEEDSRLLSGALIAGTGDTATLAADLVFEWLDRQGVEENGKAGLIDAYLQWLTLATAQAGRLSGPLPVAQVPGEAALPQRKLQVYAFGAEPEISVCSMLRLVDPAHNLADWVDFHWVPQITGSEQTRTGINYLFSIHVSPEMMAKADLFIIQRSFASLDFEDVCRHLLDSGKPVIYETDDLLHNLPPTHPHAGFSLRNGDFIRQLVRRCAAVVVSTPTLRGYFLELNPRVYVLPNLLHDRWFAPRRPRSGAQRVRIGYMGTPTHDVDLAMVERALARIAVKYEDRVDFVFLGSATEAMRRLPNAQFREKLVPYADFPELLRSMEFDIGIAPLADNQFNRCKSNIKWLEYGACGIAGIYSDLGPYRESVQDGETGLLVSGTSEEEWYGALERLITDTGLRQHIAARAEATVRQRYSLGAAGRAYLEVWQGVASGRVVSPERLQPGAPPPEALPAQQAGVAAGEAAAERTSTVEEGYQRWIDLHSLKEVDGELFAERMTRQWTQHPLCHVVVRVVPEDMAALADTIDSLAAQLYKRWRLTVFAPFPAPSPIFAEHAELAWREVASFEEFQTRFNALLQGGTDDWVICPDAGTRFQPHALIRWVDYINRFPRQVAFYADDDELGFNGARQKPRFKPELNLDYLRAWDYVGPCLLRCAALTQAGGASAYGYADRYDSLLRVIDQFGEGSVGHIADVLLSLPPTVYDEANQVPEEKAAVDDHLRRRDLDAEVQDGYFVGLRRVVFALQDYPLVSIVIPSKDNLDLIETCLETLFKRTYYRNFEVVLVDNGSTDPDVLDYYETLRASGRPLRIIDHPEPFNFSAMCNRGVAEAQGEYILLLNNDIQVIQGEWLERLLELGQRPDVGIVGARLVFPETGRLQHAGIVLGLTTVADTILTDEAGLGDRGYMNRAVVDQEYSAVTAACLLVRKATYGAVGGMNEEAFAVLFNDVDFCLKVRAEKLRVLYTPYATLVHHASVSLKAGGEDWARMAREFERSKRERENLMRRWMPLLAADPAYNRNLSLVRKDFAVESVACASWDVNFHDRPRIAGSPLSGGSGHYRVVAPLRALSVAGKAETAVIAHPKIFQSRLLPPVELARLEADTLYVHAAIDDRHLAMAEMYQEFNRDLTLVFALDDLITKVPEKSSFRKHAYRDAKPRLRRALSYCDRFIASTEPLKELARGMIDDIRVIPNRLETAVWEGYQPRRRAGPRPRVGWAGAQQHQGDLEMLEEVVRRTAGEVDWVFLGMCPETLRPYVREVHDFVSNFYEYPAKLASLNLDLALAPLELHPFNEAKSNLRLLEYGIMGYPVVCTDILPYQVGPVKCVPNTAAAWTEAIRERAHDLDATAREGDALREWVRKHWMLEDHLDEWLAALAPLRRGPR